MSGYPKVHSDPDKITQTSWKDYGIRFLFGGIITAAVGVIAKAFGPVIAGLFLAFPAILPASLTLLAKHESNKAAAIESLGAAFGSIGLMVFGLVLWLLAPPAGALVTLAVATVCWLLASVLAWLAFQTYRRKLRPRLTTDFGSPYNREAVGRGQAVRQRTLDPRS
jgi:uncharacterized membrane protein (GlpM family)